MAQQQSKNSSKELRKLLAGASQPLSAKSPYFPEQFHGCVAEVEAEGTVLAGTLEASYAEEAITNSGEQICGIAQSIPENSPYLR